MKKNEQPLLKYQQVKAYLLQKMEHGEISYGEKLPSENELALQFKISRQTVRQALGELENQGLIYKWQGKGTFRSYPKKVEGRNIALLTTYISDYIFPSIIRGVESVLSSAGYTLLLANTDNNKLKEAEHLEKFLHKEIAGLIIEPTKSADENLNYRYYQELGEKGIPYLMLHAAYEDLEPAFIRMDDEKGGYLATKYLLQLGHRKIAGIFKVDDLQGIRRKQGFLSALLEIGVEIKQESIGDYVTEQRGYYPYQFTKELLEKEPRPTAIFCYNDQIALQVIEAIRDVHLQVPEDLSVVSFDDSHLAVASEIKLTTIKHPKIEMGRQAARLLLDMLAGKIQKPELIYEPELIIRSSCRSL